MLTGWVVVDCDCSLGKGNRRDQEGGLGVDQAVMEESEKVRRGVKTAHTQCTGTNGCRDVLKKSNLWELYWLGAREVKLMTISLIAGHSLSSGKTSILLVNILFFSLMILDILSLFHCFLIVFLLFNFSFVLLFCFLFRLIL